MKNKKIWIGCASIIMLAMMNYFIFQIALNKSIDLVDVMVTNRTIYPREKITQSDITWVQIPKAYLIDGVYESQIDVIGKYIDIQSTLPKGSLFYKEILLEESMLPDYPAMLLKEGQVAFTLLTDLAKLAGNTLVVGQKVDVYVSIPFRNEKPVVDCLLKGVRIIGIKDRKGLDVTHPESNHIPYIVVLAIQEEYIPYMSSSVEMGEVQLMALATKYDANEDCLLVEESKVIPYIYDKE